ncbi:MAG TPA: C69 family dipeptidase [Anaerolineae bacterium]|nr:C69 family dipeptidase [Anaerolineae bacterium]
MCDTMVALGKATADGSTILAKNSDREPNEAQLLTYVPRQQHADGEQVQCTYIKLPQVRETFEVVLSRPFWMWGAEMGGNEHGVAIGNEAVFTKEPYGKEPGLIGMDMLRLALERTDSARGALELIIELLRTYGQSGNCGLKHPTYYHNSFLIADAREAWCLETSGQYWAAQRVTDRRTISNGLTIGREWEMASPGLVEHAIEKGWCKSAAEFDFARCYSDLIFTRLDGCRPRQCRSAELLAEQQGRFTILSAMAALRDHGARAQGPGWSPAKGLVMDTLCVHAGLGPTRPSQSTGSMVAHLSDDRPTFWLTGTSAPCTSLFKPVFLGSSGLPDLGPEATETADERSLWWRHERLHRATLKDYATRHGLYADERDRVQAAWVAEAEHVIAETRGQRGEEATARLRGLTSACFERADALEQAWLELVQQAPPGRSGYPLFDFAWRGYNRQAEFRP